MKCFLGISNFGEEFFSLSHSIVFLYFFVLITEEGFLFSPCYSLELCIQMGISFLSPLLFTSLLFTAICKASSDSHFAFFAFLFRGDGLDPCLLYSVILQDLSSIESKKLITERRKIFKAPDIDVFIRLFNPNQMWPANCYIKQNLEVVKDYPELQLLFLVLLCVLSCFSHLRLFATLWTVACQASLCMDSPGKNSSVSCHAT